MKFPPPAKLIAQTLGLIGFLAAGWVFVLGLALWMGVL